MQNSSAELKSKSKSDLLKLSVTLFVIAGIMSLLVSLVNFITAPRIEQSNKEKINQALKTVVADADSFEAVDYDKTSVTSSDGKEIGIDGVWKAKKEDTDVAICVRVSPRGYGGKIETIVAVDMTGKILKTEIVSLSETSGIGTKIQQESFLSQFIGKGHVTGVKAPSSDSEVMLISGATKSSSAYLRGINAALTVAEECMEVTANE